MAEEGSYVYSLTYDTCQFQLHCDIEITCPNVIMRQVMIVVHNKCMDHSLEVTEKPQFRHPNTRHQTAGSGGVVPLSL